MKTPEQIARELQDNLSYEDLIDPIRFASLVTIEFAKQILDEAADNAYAKADEGSVNTKDGNLFWTFGGNIGKVVIVKKSITEVLNKYLVE